MPNQGRGLGAKYREKVRQGLKKDAYFRVVSAYIDNEGPQISLENENSKYSLGEH